MICMNDDKNIYPFNGQFRIYKVIRGKTKYFGTFPSIEEARRMRDKCVREGWKNTYKKRDPERKWIQKRPSGRYYVIRKNVYYGVKDTLEEAIEFRDFLEEHDWDINLKQKQRKRGTENKNRYVYKTACGRYAIVKMIQGELKYFGAFTTLDAAKRERDLLEKCGWDEELLWEIDEQ